MKERREKKERKRGEKERREREERKRVEKERGEREERKRRERGGEIEEVGKLEWERRR